MRGQTLNTTIFHLYDTNISLPKPLWHEVMELCGGELGDLSELEWSSTDDIQFQVVDESEMDEEDDDDDDDEEMSESDTGLDEDEDDFYGYFGNNGYSHRKDVLYNNDL